jgi:hypothetical protein
MIETLTEQLINDFACLDPTYVDGIAGVLNLGSNFSTLFFRWNPARTEGGVIAYERIPALVLMQPRSALICGNGCRLNTMLEAQQPPALAPQLRTNATFN